MGTQNGKILNGKISKDLGPWPSSGVAFLVVLNLTLNTHETSPHFVFMGKI